MQDSEPIRQSLLSAVFQALGFSYTILLPLAALLSFLLVLLIVLRGKGPMAAAGLVLIVNAPLLIGLFAAVQGGLASFSVIAMSSTSPHPAEIAAGISTALYAPLVAILLTAPAYATAAFGAFFRSLAADAAPSSAKL